MRGDKASVIRKERAARAVAVVRDRRRFITTTVPTGIANRVAEHDLEGTLFPSMLRPVGGDPVLKDAATNSKIGGDVLVGWLRGARILMLALEERRTCPRSCALWASCYGNSAPFTPRYPAGPELEAAIVRDVEAAVAAHERVLVRLHLLGDFYSPEYVGLWSDLVRLHPGLAVFGFTAWGPGTAIGAAVADARARLGRRFAIRHSGRTGPWGSFTIDFPTGRKRLGDAIVCPEQHSAMNGTDDGRHCGNCAACWSSDVPVVFVEH